jgi:hypothetical protein
VSSYPNSSTVSPPILISLLLTSLLLTPCLHRVCIPITTFIGYNQWEMCTKPHIGWTCRFSGWCDAVDAVDGVMQSMQWMV